MVLPTARLRVLTYNHSHQVFVYQTLGGEPTHSFCEAEMMNYVENAMPRVLGCPDGVAGFYGSLHLADDERLHAIGVSAECTRQLCTRNRCPFHPEQIQKCPTR
jgi:hypothetical protein